ncbi:MAG TPA: hypothetical protein VKT30_17800 [Caulobacteraceae bacterium]|nr:hypothetical protein [Caulobacteraceae bacterium]
MFRLAIEGAWRLDQWLKAKVGRTYSVLLTVVLITGIVANVRTVLRDMASTGNVAAFAVTTLVYLVLIVNQLAQLHEYRQEARARREERKARKAQKAS